MPELDKDWQAAIGSPGVESKAQRLLRIEDELQAKRAAGRSESAWFFYKMILLAVFVVGAGAAVAWHFGMFGAAEVRKVTEWITGPGTTTTPFISVPSGAVTIVPAAQSAVSAAQSAMPAKPLDPKIAAQVKRLEAGIDLMEREEREGDAETGRQQAIIAEANSRLADVQAWYASHPYARLDVRRATDANAQEANADLINATRRLKELQDKRTSLEGRIKKADADAQALDGQLRQ
jgi:hypothetical protein